jgi:hypothetical protein
MITQAFKRWLHTLFEWLSGKQVAKAETAGPPFNPGLTSEQMARTALDGVTPPSGVAPLFLGQGETSCSTLEERPDRMLQPPPLLPVENGAAAAALPAETSHVEAPRARVGERDVPPTAPTPQQKLAFLHYLVERGIVNEGFIEGQVPGQYRRRGA